LSFIRGFPTSFFEVAGQNVRSLAGLAVRKITWVISRDY
jgi:hypothetical protein